MVGSGSGRPGRGAGLAGSAHASPPAHLAAPFVNWSSYLNGPAHSSDNAAATVITPATRRPLTHDWTWAPPAPTNPGQPGGLEASPTVVNGVVYIGANTGTFYALNESTGKVLWSQFLGYVTDRRPAVRSASWRPRP